MDAASFPTLVEDILSYASRDTLRNVRLVSHEMRDWADRLLSRHVRLSLGPSADDAVGVTPLGLGPPRTWLPRTVREYPDAPASYAPPDKRGMEMISRARVVDMVWSPNTFYYGYPSSFAPRHSLENAIASGSLDAAHSVRVYLPGWRDSFTNGQSVHIRAPLPENLIVFAPDGRGDLNALPCMARVSLAVDGGLHRRIPHLRLERYEAGPDAYTIHLLAEGSLPGRAKRTGMADAREEVGMLFRDTLVGDFMLALDRWARFGEGRKVDLGWGPDPDTIHGGPSVVEHSEGPESIAGDGRGEAGRRECPEVEREAAFIHPALEHRPPRYVFVGGRQAFTANFGLEPTATSLDIGRAIVSTILSSTLAVNRWVPVSLMYRLVAERVRFLTPEEYEAEVGTEQFALETKWDPYDGERASFLA